MAKPPKKKVRPPIESQVTLAEIGQRSYEMLRLTRMKYADNPYTFIDLRVFQRGYDDNCDEIYHPTRRGVHVKEGDFQRLIGKWTLVPSLLFHADVLAKSFPALERAEFDTAVFRAFRCVEIQVRKRGKLPKDLVGTALMRKAFDVDTGPLTDSQMPRAEREARSHLFCGAIGSYKNPSSHREVEYTFNEAFEMLLVASHLLQILDRIPNDQ